MLLRTIMFIANCLLALRYRIRIEGLDKIQKQGKTGILFLPNHPALIDPVIVVAKLYSRFKIRPIGHADQVNRFFIGWVARKINTLILPSLAKEGAAGANAVKETIESAVLALKNGDNLLMYPSGALYRSKYEKIGTNSGVEQILRAIPDLQIVLIRSTGLWGSRFSWGYNGSVPLVGQVMSLAVKVLLSSGIFFLPKRQVTLDVYQPEQFPRHGSRRDMNLYLEEYYNRKVSPALYVPYSLWDKEPVHELPEPKMHRVISDTSVVPKATRELVSNYIIERTGMTSFADSSSLAGDLGLDSLAVSDIAIWIEQEFGHPQTDIESLQTVGDLMLAACGQAVWASEAKLRPVNESWFKAVPDFVKFDNMSQMTICQAFLEQAHRNPDKVVLADDKSGIKSYRDIILGIMVLSPLIRKMKGDYIGIMLPASAAAPVIYMAVVFAGKIPVMVNWTSGSKNLGVLMDNLEVSTILTSGLLVEKLKGQGVQLDSISERLMALEKLGSQIGILPKIWAKFKSAFCWRELYHVKPAETAVVLFTSGSENVPKAVPLTHKNIMSNIDSLLDYFKFSTGDIMLGMLPPFHSFGLTGLVVVPLVVGVRAVYWPNPNEGGMLARMTEAYKATFLLGTPTFLNGIIRAAGPGALVSIKSVVTGAEKCPSHVYDALERVCPQAVVQEAYGITECSPGVCVNSYDDPHRETIGRVISCMEYAIVDPESLKRTEIGERGLLLVRGDNVFGGYLKHEGSSPFIEFEGKSWYNTGDLVIEDQGHVLTFAGRLKRFVKLGGEMISLPAIEEVLNRAFVNADMLQAGPVFAVVPSSSDDNPELVLFATIGVDREQVNTAIRQSGLSGLHNIRQVRQLDELPVLGSGKQDYRKLSEMMHG